MSLIRNMHSNKNELKMLEEHKRMEFMSFRIPGPEPNQVTRFNCVYYPDEKGTENNKGILVYYLRDNPSASNFEVCTKSQDVCRVKRTSLLPFVKQKIDDGNDKLS
jgi:hypothetical protein